MGLFLWALAILVAFGLFGVAVAPLPQNADWQFQLGVALGGGGPLFLGSGAVALIVWAFTKFRREKRYMVMTVWTITAAAIIMALSISQTYVASRYGDTFQVPAAVAPDRSKMVSEDCWWCSDPISPVTDPQLIAYLNAAVALEGWFNEVGVALPDDKEQAQVIDAAKSLCGRRVPKGPADINAFQSCTAQQMKGLAYTFRYYIDNEPNLQSAEPCVARNPSGQLSTIDWDAAARCLRLY